MSEHTPLLPRKRPEDLSAPRRLVIPEEIRERAAGIVREVREGGEPALRAYAEELDGLRPGGALFLGRSVLEAALDTLPADDRRRLRRVADRIRRFAEAQRACMRELEIGVPGGRAGHHLAPLERAGCYAPGGRYPLPSSLLMTAITARAAGVESVWAASPRPAPITLAAAAVAGVDGLLAAGGAQAIAALAYGCGPVAAADIVVGPGNLWVSAAKLAISADTAIDMVAGPSELAVIADGTADPRTVAADLLAQAEHDEAAVPVLLTDSAELVEAVEEELAAQLEALPTRDTARAALANGAAVVCDSIQEAARLCGALAPEHLQIATADPGSVLRLVPHYGAAFVGERSAEVLGDYGAGPNHVLPTGGRARSTGGLSVFHFLRARTWLEIEDQGEAAEIIEDAVWLARQEGLEGHARAAEERLGREADS